MKKLFLLLLVVISLQAFAQNDTTKYFNSADYGWKYKRLKAVLALNLPTDTVANKLVGSIASLNGVAYIKTTFSWDALSSTGAVFKLASDSVNVDGYTTRGRLQKVIDSLNGVIAVSLNTKLDKSDSTLANRITADRNFLNASLPLKVNISDTANMLSPYQKSFSAVKYGDTASMLSHYYNMAAVGGLLNLKLDKSDSTIANRVTANRVYADAVSALKLNISDSAAMLSSYYNKTASDSKYGTIANLALKVNYTDTAAMLGSYYNKTATDSKLALKLDKSDSTIANRVTADRIYTDALGATKLDKSDSTLANRITSDRNFVNNSLPLKLSVSDTAAALGGQYYNKVTVDGKLGLKESLSNKNIANGYAGLDAGGKVAVAQLPSTLMLYKGTWSAATNTPTLSNLVGSAGWVYQVSNEGIGNYFGIVDTFYVGDYIMYNGTDWEVSAGTYGVRSVNGKQGVVTLGNLSTSYGLSGSSFNGTNAVSDWKVDSIALTTHAWHKKGIDSVANVASVANALKVNISDTAAMLGNYYNKTATNSLLATYLPLTAGFSTPLTGSLNIKMATPTQDYTSSSDITLKHSIVANGFSSITPSGNTFAFRVASGSTTQVTPLLLKGDNSVTVGSALYSITGDFSGTLTANSIVKSGGTSSQILLANGTTTPTTTFSPLAGSSSITTVGTLSSGSIPYSLLTGTPSIPSVSGTTNYIPKFSGSTSIGNSNLQTDASGNFGIGITPSAWSSSWKAIELGNAGNALTNNAINGTGISANAILTATGWKYGGNGYANFFITGNTIGDFTWYSAPSGIAGNPITFTQVFNIAQNGNITTSASGSLTLGSTSGTGTGSLYAGAITGTTGAFSGKVGVGGATNTLGFLEVWKSGSGIAQFSLGQSATYHTDMFVDASGNFYLQPQGTTALSLSSTGAITASQNIYTGQGFAVNFQNAAGNSNVQMYNDGATGVSNLNINRSVSITGAITAASSVGVNTGIQITGASSFITGLGVEIDYGGATAATGRIYVYDRSGGTGFKDFGIGDIGSSKGIIVKGTTGILQVQNTTASTSTTTGALVVSGGVGVAGGINANTVTWGTAGQIGSLSYGTGFVTLETNASNTSIKILPNGSGSLITTAITATSIYSSSSIFCGQIVQSDWGFQLKSYTYATLPSLSIGTQGFIAYITDSNTSTYGAVVGGGGSTKTLVLWNGTNWICH